MAVLPTTYLRAVIQVSDQRLESFSCEGIVNTRPPSFRRNQPFGSHDTEMLGYERLRNFQSNRQGSYVPRTFAENRKNPQTDGVCNCLDDLCYVFRPALRVLQAVHTDRPAFGNLRIF